MTKIKGKASGSNLLKIARQMDTKIRKTASRALWKSTGADTLVKTLFPDPVESEDLIQLAQILWDAGRIDDDEAIFFMEMGQGKLYDQRCKTDKELARISRAMRAIEKREGLKSDEYFPLNDPDTPEDFMVLNDEYKRRLDEIRAAILREHGEDEIADLLLTNGDEYDRRRERGRERVTMKPMPKDFADKLREVRLARKKRRDTRS